MSYKQIYSRWLEKADASLQEELRGMSEARIEDAFYRDLAFGTGGLRGVIGAGQGCAVPDRGQVRHRRAGGFGETDDTCGGKQEGLYERSREDLKQ